MWSIMLGISAYLRQQEVNVNNLFATGATFGSVHIILYMYDALEWCMTLCQLLGCVVV